MSLRSVKYVSGSETLDTNYDTFLIDATDASITFTLSDIVNDGENFWIKRTDSSTNTVTIQGHDSSQPIEEQSSINLTPGVGIIIVSSIDNGNNKKWYYL